MLAGLAFNGLFGLASGALLVILFEAFAKLRGAPEA